MDFIDHSTSEYIGQQIHWATLFLFLINSTFWRVFGIGQNEQKCSNGKY